MDSGTSKILVADDDPAIRRVLQDTVERAGYTVVEAKDGSEAIDLADEQVSVALLDIHMPKASGLECLHYLREHYPSTEVVLISGVGEVAEVVTAMKEGAFDYITKPFDPDELIARVHMAARTSRMMRDNEGLQAIDASTPPWPGSLSRVPLARKMFERVLKIAKLDSTVLISGESGSGKTTIARLIHRQGSRAESPFVAINCASLPRDLVEAELFGHSRGAFTGAVADRPGRAEVAEGGTLFLDEISDLPIELQPKLLTFLQERTFERVGSNKACHADVRVIAATHQDLATMCRERRFRQDLFYRLSVLTLDILPLRLRKADIPDIVAETLENISRRHNSPVPLVDDAAMDILCEHDWPGNIRELENVLERAWGFRNGPTITKEDLIFERTSALTSESPPARPSASTGPCTLAEIEKQAILDMLEQCKGNKALAARQLGISEKTIYNKLKRHGLRKSK